MDRRHFRLISAVHLFFIRNGEILLLRRANTGYQDGKFSVVAGHLDGNETVKQAAIREAQEEVDVLLRPPDLSVVQVMHRRSQDERIDWFLVTERWDGEIRNREPERCDLLAWHKLGDLPENVIPYVAHAINNYLAGIWFDSFGWDS
jgi:ADP-ribose pyrophosphatase YjhB (NUDIX family)